jgi:fatty-acyl-CoA synthase
VSPPAVGVGSWIERRARISPDRVALVHGSRSSTYAELSRRVRRLANGLRGLGVAPGDRIVWIGPNHPAFLEALFAVGLLRCSLAPVNHRLGTDVLAPVLEDIDPTAVIHHGGIGEIPIPTSVRHRIAVGGSERGRDGLDFDELIERSTDEPMGIAIGMEDMLLLPHTSGTSGTPKGVMLTHGNVTWNVLNMLSFADFRGSDVTVAIAPFFRVGGIGVNVLPVLYCGGTVVVPEQATAGAILAAMERHRVTVGFGNPDLLDALARDPAWPDTDLSDVRFVITGGAPVPERLIRVYLERGVPLLQGYGLSETAPAVLLLSAADSLAKVGSAGKPPLFVDVRIVDADGAEVGTGETGELLVRGPNVMAGYWKRPDETRLALTDDGWLRTGDAARVDEDGFFWIVDRVAARFSVGGQWVYPGDVERALMEHPAVADAGVVGAPSPAGNTTAIGFVVLAPATSATADELIESLRGRLPAPMVPSTIRFVGTLPRNSVGKLLRERLTELLPIDP